LTHHRKGAGFKSLAKTWADAKMPHGRLMRTILGSLAEFERDLILGSHQRGQGSRQGWRRQPPTPHQLQEALER
jgi:DNA invertase Pin-like site-specific DNA recombinase